MGRNVLSRPHIEHISCGKITARYFEHIQQYIPCRQKVDSPFGLTSDVTPVPVKCSGRYLNFQILRRLLASFIWPHFSWRSMGYVYEQCQVSWMEYMVGDVIDGWTGNSTRQAMSTFRVCLAVPTFPIVTMNDMLYFLLPFLLCDGSIKVNWEERTSPHLYTFFWMIAVRSMAITETAVGTVAIDVSVNSGLLEVLGNEWVWHDKNETLVLHYKPDSGPPCWTKTLITRLCMKRSTYTIGWHMITNDCWSGK